MPAMPKVTNSSIFNFFPYGRRNQETSDDNAFTSAARQYVPRPLGHETQRTTLMHPLAGERPIATTGTPAPNAEASQSSDAQPVKVPSSPVLAQPDTDASMEQDVVSYTPPPVIIQPSSKTALVLRFGHAIAQSVSNAAMEQVQISTDIQNHIPAKSTAPSSPQSQPKSLSYMPHGHTFPSSSSPVLAQPDTDASMEQSVEPYIPPSDAALELRFGDQISAADNASPAIAQPISDAAMEQVSTDIQHHVPAISTAPSSPQSQPKSLSHMHHGHTAMFRFGMMNQISNRRNDDSRVIRGEADDLRRVTENDSKRVTENDMRRVTEKTRLVEQLDMTTRKIIENKDQKISELEAQVEKYKTMMDKLSMRMEDLERKAANESHNIGGPLSHEADFFRHEEQEIRNTNNQGQPVLTREDVNMDGQPNRDGQIHELDQAPLAFGGKDINMRLQPMCNNNPHEQVQAPEVNTNEQAMDTGRTEDVRPGVEQSKRILIEDEQVQTPEVNISQVTWAKQPKRILDEDEEEFDFDEDLDLIESDDSEIEKVGSSGPSVPKPIYSFTKPRGGAGPRLQTDPQTSTSANPVPNIPNTTTPTLQLAGISITSEQIAAITNIVMAVQNQNTPQPSQSRKMNITGTIKEQKSRLEKNPRRSVLVAAVRRHLNSLLTIEHDSDIKWRSQPSREIVDDFAEGKGSNPGLVPMQLAFKYTKKEAWNKNLGEQFFDDFLVQEGSKLRLQDNEWPLIYELFWQRFDNLKKEWKKWQKKDGENDMEVHHRNSTKFLMDLRRKRRNARRRQLTDTRLKITEGNAKKADGTMDDVWHFLWLVASKLDLGGMSSDESNDDRTSRKHFVKSVPWRNEELLPYLQRIDNDFNRLNTYGNRRPGNPFRDRVRLPGMKSSTLRPAIRGLPINFYDKTWYADLSNSDIRYLQAKPELQFPVIVEYH